MKTVWLTIFTTVFSVVLTVLLQENYEKLFPTNGVIYQILSSPNKYTIFAGLLLLGISPFLYWLIDKYLVSTSKELIRSFYALLSGKIIKPLATLFSFACVCFTFGCLIQATTTHGWVILRDHKYADELQRQRLIEKGNEQIREGNTEKAISYYQNILDNNIDSSHLDYALENHIKQIKLAEKYWSEKSKDFYQTIERHELYNAGYELFQAHETLNNKSENIRMKEVLKIRAFDELDNFSKGIGMCKGEQRTDYNFFVANGALFSSLSRNELSYYISSISDNVKSSNRVLESICQRLRKYSDAHEYFDALISGSIYEAILEEQNDEEFWDE